MKKMAKPPRLTAVQRAKLERDNKIRREWAALLSDPEQSRMEALRFLMAKYGIHSTSTFYRIINEKIKKI